MSLTTTFHGAGGKWSCFTPEEVAALDRVQQLLLAACAVTPQTSTDDGFIASGWPAKLQPAAVYALKLMHARGRFREDVEQEDSSAAHRPHIGQTACIAADECSCRRISSPACRYLIFAGRLYDDKQARWFLTDLLPAARRMWFRELFGDPEERRNDPRQPDDLQEIRARIEHPVRAKVAEEIEANIELFMPLMDSKRWSPPGSLRILGFTVEEPAARVAQGG